MPLSKKRDRERKQLARLESNKIQPKLIRPYVHLDEIPTFTSYDVLEIDADGNPIYEE